MVNKENAGSQERLKGHQDSTAKCGVWVDLSGNIFAMNTKMMEYSRRM